MKITILDNPEYNDIKNILQDEVFHITSERNFKKINEDGCLFHQSSSPHPGSPDEISYSRKNQLIALFNFKDANDDQVENSLVCYQIQPKWLSGKKVIENSVFSSWIYLILSDNYYPDIINQNNVVFSSLCNYKYVLHTECWHSSPLEIDKFKEVLIVREEKTYNPNSLASIVEKSMAENGF